MNNTDDQLRQTFEAHEHLAPDAIAVYARVQELSKTYQRRRRGAQAAGGAVLGVGLIAGGMNLPGSGGARPAVVVAAPAAAPAATTTPPPSPASPAEVEKQLAAYFTANYGPDDARELARIWNLQSEDLLSVKAEAGRRLLADEVLPVEPSGGVPEPADPTRTKRIDAFFAAGYDYADAETLSKLWKTDDTFDAKALAGKKLLAGETLPIQP